MYLLAALATIGLLAALSMALPADNPQPWPLSWHLANLAFWLVMLGLILWLG